MGEDWGRVHSLLSDDPVNVLVPLIARVILTPLPGLLSREEARLNARGETLFPWAVRRAFVPRNVLSACLLDVGADGVAGRLRGLPLSGRAGLCRDVAARCLVEAARHRRLADRLTREAEGWLRETIKELRR